MNDRRHATVLDGADAVMREVVLAGERYRLAAAEHLGVSIVDSQAISYLLARGPMGPNELAEALDLTTGSVTVVIDRLEKRGFVRRAPHASDRRRVVVRLSAQGDRAVRALTRSMRQSLSELSDEEREHIVATAPIIAACLARAAALVPAEVVDGAAPVRRRR